MDFCSHFLILIDINQSYNQSDVQKKAPTHWIHQTSSPLSFKWWLCKRGNFPSLCREGNSCTHNKVPVYLKKKVNSKDTDRRKIATKGGVDQ